MDGYRKVALPQCCVPHAGRPYIRGRLLFHLHANRVLQNPKPGAPLCRAGFYQKNLLNHKERKTARHSQTVHRAPNHNAEVVYRVVVVLRELPHHAHSDLQAKERDSCNMGPDPLGGIGGHCQPTVYVSIGHDKNKHSIWKQGIEGDDPL